MVGIPWLADRDKFSEYLPSVLCHVAQAAEYAGVEIRIYKTKPRVGGVPPPGRARMTAITEKLDEIREEFRATGWPLLWIVDADVEVPLHSLKELLLLDVDVASGVYLYKNNPDGLVLTAGILHPGGAHFLKLYQMRGKVLGENERVMGGNGCLLIKRRVFDRHFDLVPPIKFRAPMGAPGSDILFFKEAQKMGFETRLHGGVICGHLPASPLEKLNEYLEKTK